MTVKKELISFFGQQIKDMKECACCGTLVEGKEICCECRKAAAAETE